MRPLVTAIVFVPAGANGVQATLEALAAQRRQADNIVIVGEPSNPDAAALGPAVTLLRTGRGDVNEAIRQAQQALAGQVDAEHSWLWLLRHDAVPEQNALAELLATVERSPSVAVAGPKLLHAAEPQQLVGFGLTMTTLGRLVAQVPQELDQGQFDTRSDVLAVALTGALVRSQVWTQLEGADPALHGPDASLDFCVRVRLAGYRVSVAADARMTVDGALFGLESLRRYGQHSRRAAWIHRRLVYSPGGALPLHWLSLPVLAVLRAIGWFFAKRPQFVPAEFTALTAGLGFGAIGRARRILARNRRSSWAAIAPLRRSPEEARQLRSVERERQRARRRGSVESAGFFSRGGALTAIALAVVGLIVFGPLLGASTVSGGALLPLGPLEQLWQSAGWTASGTVTAPEPFQSVLAVLGSLVPWAPSYAVLLLLILSMPLAGIGAWYLSAGITGKPAVRALAAIAWALAPMYLSAITTGRLGAALAHLLLPWLLLMVHRSPRSWSAVAVAALLLAAVVASAPTLAPLLAVLLLALCLIRLRSWYRFLLIPVPAAVLAAPLVLQQLQQGRLLELFADPAQALPFAASAPWELALGFPETGLGGWDAWMGQLGIEHAGLVSAAVVAALLLPFGVTALLAMLLRTMPRAVVAFSLALLGYLGAVVTSLVSVGVLGLDQLGIWPGAALSLYWLGLLGAVVLALANARTMARPVVLGLGLAGAVLPLLAATLTGTAQIAPDHTRLPAIAVADAVNDTDSSTLVVIAQADGGMRVELLVGFGPTLEQYPLPLRIEADAEEQLALAQTAVDLVTGNAAAALDSLRERDIRYVLLAPPQQTPAGTALEPAPPTSEATRFQRQAANALDSTSSLSRVSDTGLGVLWRLGIDTEGAGAVPPEPSHPAMPWLAIWAVVLAGTVLMAIPVSRTRRGGSDV